MHGKCGINRNRGLSGIGVAYYLDYMGWDCIEGLDGWMVTPCTASIPDVYTGFLLANLGKLVKSWDSGRMGG